MIHKKSIISWEIMQIQCKRVPSYIGEMAMNDLSYDISSLQTYIPNISFNVAILDFESGMVVFFSSSKIKL